MSDLQYKIENCKVLLVGAGGIGCEVLKNLTLSGFKNVDAIDLDTIDVSNLNRQFLFNKSNVGQSKSKVAIEIARKEYAPTQDCLNLNAIHKSITLSEFDIDFFKQYSFVINALDNRNARSHVNRMCLAAKIPLLESGTAGYTGQLKLIKNSLTSCYECDGIQREGRTYATCTIRNTPSQPIHCIVWAKHLFYQLFGENDPDNDVSPQMDEKQIDVDKLAENNKSSDNNNENTVSQPISTRELAIKHNYEPEILFDKLYNHDIQYLLSMDNLWKNRSRPKTLDYSLLTNGEVAQSSKSIENDNEKLGQQRLWTLKECAEIFKDTVKRLHKQLTSSGSQTWDKDDEVALNFVVAASNLRSKCFDIERKSPFDVKSLAGNIIPAISSTNSIIGGLLVLQAIRLLKCMPIGEEYTKLEDPARNELIKDAGKTTFLNYTSLTRQDLISSFECSPPLPTCLGCFKGEIPEVELRLSMKNTSLADLVDKIIISTFNFVWPDLSVDDNSGIIIWSKDEDSEDDDSTKGLKLKKLLDMPHIKAPKTRLMVSDLLQDKQLILVLVDEEVDEEKHKSFFYAHMNGHVV